MAEGIRLVDAYLLGITQPPTVLDDCRGVCFLEEVAPVLGAGESGGSEPGFL